jgi:hypothetical protein
MTEKSQQVSSAEEDLDTELIYWLPEGAQLVTIEVFIRHIILHF